MTLLLSIHILLTLFLEGDYARPVFNRACEEALISVTREVAGTSARFVRYQQTIPRSLRAHAKPVDFQRLEVRLTVADAQEFARLKRHFRFPGIAQSQVAFPATERGPVEMSLTDFLPPAIQALDGLRWASVNVNRLEEQPTSANCWATAYEVMRLSLSGDTELVISSDHGEKTLAIFADPAYFATIRTDPVRTAAEIPPFFELSNILRPGDILLVWGNNEIMPGTGRMQAGVIHVAIYTGEGLLFEKFSDDPSGGYRILDYRDLVEGRILPALGVGDTATVSMQWIRATGRELPKLSALFDRPFDVSLVPSHRDIPKIGGFFPDIYRTARFRVNQQSRRAEFPVSANSFTITANIPTKISPREAGREEDCVVPAGTRLRIAEVIGFWKRDDLTDVVLGNQPDFPASACRHPPTGIFRIRTGDWSVGPRSPGP